MRAPVIRARESRAYKLGNSGLFLWIQNVGLQARTTNISRARGGLQSSHTAAFALAASSSLRLCAAFSSSLRLRSFSRTALS